MYGLLILYTTKELKRKIQVLLNLLTRATFIFVLFLHEIINRD